MRKREPRHRRGQPERELERPGALPGPRIAVIGDTHLERGLLTNGGAIACAITTGWPVETGFRSVAHSADAWEALDGHFGACGVTTWLMIRDEDSPGIGASIRMGDVLNIDELFAHDLVIVACRDVALRRFLADLPVHTYPGVRILSLIHFEEGPIEGERLEDLTRFDVIVGGERDFARISGAATNEDAHPLVAMHPVIHATNVRAAISWGRAGEFACIGPTQPLLTVPAIATSEAQSPLAWAAFVGAIAMGMIERQSWEETGRAAVRQFALHSQID